MRILVLTNKPPYPLKDGGAIAVFNLAKGLADCGNQVYILAMNTPKHYVKQANIPDFERLTIKMVDVNSNIKPYKAVLNFLFSNKPFNAQRFISKQYAEELENLLQKDNYDIIQFEGPYLWPYISIIKKHSKARISFRAHNIEHEIWQRTAANEKRFFKKQYISNLARRIERFEKQLINQYDYLIPITKRDKDRFDNMGNTKPSLVVPVGLVTSTINYQPSNYKCSAYYIGALDWMPNQEGITWFIDKVWPKVLQKEPCALLHIAGRNAPKWLITKTGAKNIMYHGEVSDAHSYMHKYGLMVVPLFSGSGMRVKIVEGMALGKAIITSSIGAEGIDITHRENILIADNENDFANMVIDMFQNSDLANQISLNARKFALENYDNNLVANKLSLFYQHPN